MSDSMQEAYQRDHAFKRELDDARSALTALLDGERYLPQRTRDILSKAEAALEERSAQVVSSWD